MIPGSKYLKELRETIHSGKDVSDYSNGKVINYFRQKLDVKEIQNINYSFDVKKELLPYFVSMTPLTWGQSADRLNDIYEKNTSTITVDLTLIIGMKKK
ncbi:hypothetical protein [Geosporobacter ferrireducens]|uniref:hypothetical protein n=1 Tax=Geosporobacter ferrireducens TaxID=1424294 RepID=UPI001F25EADD|nr:hypothetical protein [Geosporobacter ferrireducens]